MQELLEAKISTQVFTYMNKSPAFQFYSKEWLSSMPIMLMSPAQEGAYIRLLCICWESGDCSIPDDDNQLAVLSRLGEGWFNGGSKLVRERFIPHPTKEGFLTNERLVKESSKQSEWSEKSSFGGKKSAEKRALQKSKSNGGSTVVQGCLTDGTNQKPTLQFADCSLHTAVVIPPTPKGDEKEIESLRRARALFKMRESTPMDKSLTAAWKSAKPVVLETLEEEWKLLEARYSSTDEEISRYRRRDLPTLLNNWSGEIAKSNSSSTARKSLPSEFDHAF